MADTRIRLAITRTSGAMTTTTDYTPNIMSVVTEEILNEPGTFEVVLAGNGLNTADMAGGNLIEIFCGTSSVSANRFFKGTIQKVEGKTATYFKLTGAESGWVKLMNRQHATYSEWGTQSLTRTNITRASLIDKLRSEDLSGAGTMLIGAGTIASSGTNVVYFSSDLEKRHTPFFRAAQIWGTEAWISQDMGDNDLINITTKGTDVSATRIFYLSGANKNCKLGSNVIDTQNMYTLVTVLGAGDGTGQIKGQSNSGVYTPVLDPKRDIVIQRPDLKTNDECASLAQNIWTSINQPIQKIQIAPNTPFKWLVGTFGVTTGDTVALAASNIASISNANYRVFEKRFECNFETGVFELRLQLNYRMTRATDRLADVDYLSTKSFSTTQFQQNGLSTIKGTRLGLGSHIDKMDGFLFSRGIWITRSGDLNPATYSYEGRCHIILENAGTYVDKLGSSSPFLAHIKYPTGVTANPSAMAVLDEGATYYNSSSKTLRLFDGTNWVDIGPGGGGGGGYWSRSAGPPAIVYPTTAGDSVVKNTTGSLGVTGTRWDKLWVVDVDVSGNTILGTTSANTVTFNARIASNLVPTANNTYDLGTVALNWRDLWLSRDATIVGNLYVGGNYNLIGKSEGDLIPKNDLTNDIGSATNRWRNLFIGRNTTLGVTTADKLTINAGTTSILPFTDNTHQLGSNALHWSNIYLKGTINPDSQAITIYTGNINAVANVTYDIGTSGTQFRSVYCDTVHAASLVASASLQLLPGAKVLGHLIPLTSDTYDLGQGTSPLVWRTLYSGKAVISTSAVGAVSALLYVNGNSNFRGNMLLGLNTGSTLTFNGSINSNVQVASNNTYDLATSVVRFRAMYMYTLDVLGNSYIGLTTANTCAISASINSDLIPTPNLSRNLGDGFTPKIWNQAFIKQVIISSTALGLGVPELLYVNGTARVIGFLTKSGGGFAIDHPQDPHNKELIHSFVESPEMLNLYRGRARLIKGKCKITLPAYFEALNGKNKEEYGYIFTPIKNHKVNLYVSKEIDNNEFEVSGDSDCEFCWMVSAVRHDSWAEANRPAVEREKKQKGTFIYSDYYNKHKVG